LIAWFVARSSSEGILATNFSGVFASQTPDGEERLPKAVLWDMDGTLVDTEPYWYAAEAELVAAHGGLWVPADALGLVGNSLHYAATQLHHRGGVDLPVEQIMEQVLDGVLARIREHVPWSPGALELIADLADHDVPQGLVTNSYFSFAEPMLAELPAGAFGAVVTGDRVDNMKPHPQPYLLACELLSVEPALAVAIEDSNTGATSAEVAGCVVLVVESHVPVSPGERRIFAETLPSTAAALYQQLGIGSL